MASLETSAADTNADRRTVVSVFEGVSHAERALNALKAAGFLPDQVSVVARESSQTQALLDSAETDAESATAGTGAMLGGLTGGVVGWLVGIGALAIPGVGPVVAGGALASAFGLGGGTAVAGAGIGAAAGGIVGALTGLGFSKDEAEYYDRGVREGRTLVTIHDDEGRAAGIFDETGADRYRDSTTTTTTTRRDV